MAERWSPLHLRLHHWDLQLWHGDHRWRPESSQQAAELGQWAASQGLGVVVDCWPITAATNSVISPAELQQLRQLVVLTIGGLNEWMV